MCSVTNLTLFGAAHCGAPHRADTPQRNCEIKKKKKCQKKKKLPRFDFMDIHTSNADVIVVVF